MQPTAIAFRPHTFTYVLVYFNAQVQCGGQQWHIIDSSLPASNRKPNLGDKLATQHTLLLTHPHLLSLLYLCS